ncbi:MAG: CFI-box-CTERM domain-containing protein [Candidatus Hodarchaeota archaeon]
MDLDHNTIEFGLKYRIKHGQVGDIVLTDGPPPLPPRPEEMAAPTLTKVWVVIRCNLDWNPPESGTDDEASPDNVPPDWLSLVLYKLKGPILNPDVAPESVGNPDNYGKEIVREDDVGHAPKLEDSDLWKHYISQNWEKAPGYREDMDTTAAQNENLDEVPHRIDETQILGRNVHQVNSPGGVIVFPTTPVPLRVAIGIGALIGPSITCTTKLLALIKIKRRGRLCLKAWPMKLHFEVPDRIEEVRECFECFIATAAYGSRLSPQVRFLRYIRDQRLKLSNIGSILIDIFESIYYKFSANVAKTMDRFPRFKIIMRFLVVSPIVKFLMFLFKRFDPSRLAEK